MTDFKNIAIPGLAQTQVSGLDELEKKFKDLAPNQARKAFREAAEKSSLIWIDAMRERAPIGSEGHHGNTPGFLSRSIGASITASGAKEALIMHVGPSKEAFYAGWVEHGTKKMGPRPYARPAFLDHQDDVMHVFADELWRALKALES